MYGDEGSAKVHHQQANKGRKAEASIAYSCQMRQGPVVLLTAAAGTAASADANGGIAFWQGTAQGIRCAVLMDPV